MLIDHTNSPGIPADLAAKYAALGWAVEAGSTKLEAAVITCAHCQQQLIMSAERTRLAGEVDRVMSDDRYYSYAHENFSYITQGLYFEPLRKWFDHYPREQVFIESTEVFLENPQRVYDRVLQFLGLPPFQLRDVTPLEVNPAADPLSVRTRAELAARVAPHNKRLEEYLGITFGWDEQPTA